jgi:hypothetical protein
MTPQQRQKLDKHVAEIAQILYEEATAEGEKVESLAQIEQLVRGQVLEYISPQIGIAFIKKQQKQQQEE